MKKSHSKILFPDISDGPFLGKKPKKVRRIKAWAQYVPDENRLAICTIHGFYATFPSKEAAQANNVANTIKNPIIQIIIEFPPGK